MTLVRAAEWPGRESSRRGVPRIDEIVVLASPRSGTNYFCECLNAFPEICGYYEIFNSAGVFGISGEILHEVSLRLGLDDVENAKDQRLTSAFRDRPLEALEALADVSARTGASAMSYKVFPGQLSPETIERLLDDDHRHPVFLTRRRLDAYISYHKAQESQAWANTSTVHVRPTIHAEEFLEWASEMDAWYAECLDIARATGKKLSIARYDTDIDLPSPTSSNEHAERCGTTVSA